MKNSNTYSVPITVTRFQKKHPSSHQKAFKYSPTHKFQALINDQKCTGCIYFQIGVPTSVTSANNFFFCDTIPFFVITDKFFHGGVLSAWDFALISIILQKTAFSLVKSSLALGSLAGCQFVCLSPCILSDHFGRYNNSTFRKSKICTGDKYKLQRGHLPP